MKRPIRRSFPPVIQLYKAPMISSVLKLPKIIVCSNRKGGVGKTTCACLITTYLLHLNKKIFCLDLDYSQYSFFNFLEQRKQTLKALHYPLPLPKYQKFSPPSDPSDPSDPNDPSDKESSLKKKVADVLQFLNTLASYDYLIVDTPGHLLITTQILWAFAHHIILPLNESILDLSVLIDIHSQDKLRPFAEQLLLIPDFQETMFHRKATITLFLNRISNIKNSHHKRRIMEIVEKMQDLYTFQIGSPLSERLIYKELYEFGLTPIEVRYIASLRRQYPAWEKSLPEIDTFFLSLNLLK